MPFPAGTTGETQLLRISCQQLQQLPVPPTLAATINVDEARRELETARSMSRVGDLMTYLGVPLSIAGTLAGTPELAASGIDVA